MIKYTCITLQLRCVTNGNCGQWSSRAFLSEDGVRVDWGKLDFLIFVRRLRKRVPGHRRVTSWVRNGEQECKKQNFDHFKVVLHQSCIVTSQLVSRSTYVGPGPLKCRRILEWTLFC